MKRPATISLKWWDTTTLFASLGILVIMCWFFLIGMARDMNGMEMAMQPMAWSFGYFSMMLGMWIVMMVGMMVPTAVRSILIFSRLSFNATASGHAFASGHWFALGYVIAWSLFSVAATLLQWTLDQLALLSPMMTTSNVVLTAIILASAGLWQFSSWKETCLRHCRSPMEFLAANFAPGIGGAIRMGIWHGFYCLGCCWVLMGLLFVGGVMNLACIAAITAFVLVEKLFPNGSGISRVAGIGLMVSGALCLMLDWS